MTTYRRMTILAALTLACASFAPAADVAGKWKSEFQSPIGHLKYTYDLKQDGDKLTGKAIRELEGAKTESEIKEGKVTGDEVAFVEPLKLDDQDVLIEYKGKLAGDEIKFTRKVGDFATMEIVAKREKATTASVAGQWQAEFDTQIGKQKYTFMFKEDGDKLTGKANAEIGDDKFETAITEGKLKAQGIFFVEPLNYQGTELRIEYNGKLSGDEIKFTRKVGDVATEEFAARRVKQPDQKSEQTPASPATAELGTMKKITLKVVKVDSAETDGEDGKGANAVDGQSSTFWHTAWDENVRPPHEITIELSAPAKIKGFTYLPRQDEQVNGTIKDYEFYVSNDGKDFGKPVKKGSFEGNKEKKTVTFEAKQCQFIKLKMLTEVNDAAWTSAAEITVIPE